MHITGAQLMALVADFVWPFFRIGALFASMPMIGSRVVPVRIRLGLAVLLSIAVSPMIPAVPQMDLISIDAFVIVLEQILIGVTMGFVFHLVFTMFVIGGQVIAMQMGLGFASMIDPQNGVQVPVISQLYVLMVTLLFMAFDGHLLLITVLVESFQQIPIGGAHDMAGSWWKVISWGSVMFGNAIKVVLPAMATLLLVNLSFGVITRSAPQFNIFAVGLPFTLAFGFVAIYVVLPNVVSLFEQFLFAAFSLIREL